MLLFVAACLAFAVASLAVSAQRRVSFDGKTDSELTVEKQSSSDVKAWWPAFVEQNTLEGYCWNLNTLPLADRPQLGDK